MNRPAKVFISYSREDAEHCRALRKSLAVLERQGEITIWHDRQIGPGEEWEGVIAQKLDDADLVLLLLTQDFLASKYIWEVEIKRALERHDSQGARVIPIFVSSCDWTKTPLARLQGIPNPRVPIDLARNPAEAWAAVAAAIRGVLSPPDP